MRILCFAGALLSLVTAAAMMYRATRLSSEPYLGMSEREVVVALVTPHGPADRAGLIEGDRIRSIEGIPVERLVNPSAVLRLHGPDRPVRLEIERAGKTLPVALSPERLPLGVFVWKLAHAGVALATLLVGTLVLLRKAGRLTLVFFGICLALATLLFRPAVLPGQFGLTLDAVGAQVLSALLPGLLLHFFLLFPYERAALQRHPAVHVLPYLPGLALLVLDRLNGPVQSGLGLDGEQFGAAVDTIGGFYALAALIGSVILFAQAYRQSPLPTIRQKLRVTLGGTLLGLLPLLLVLTLHTVRPDLNVPGDQAATLMVFFLPASFGYAILRHGIFEIEFIVKRSLVYSGMTAGIILAYFVAYFVLHALLHNVTDVDEGLGKFLAVGVAVLLLSPLRGRIQDKLDRWVYPDRYEYRRALRETGLLLREATGTGTVEQALLQAIRLLLGVERAGLFRRTEDDGTFVLTAQLERSEILGGTQDEPARPRPTLGRLLADPLFRTAAPSRRGDLEAELPYGFLPQGDLQALEQFEAQVLIPLASGTRRLGILVLGHRRFNEPYSPPDLELLDGYQAQAVLALENAFFQAENAGRAVLVREMEVARALQQQLLPQRLPKLACFELAASNIPCREIGGDYFDILQSGSEDLTLAIGDVSGKGVPAALLMANVQATFRAEVASGRRPHEVLERMNRRLCGIESPDRFVSFFCGKLDLAHRLFAYANAGHLHPMLIRNDGTVDRLDRGGLLLGIFEESAYEGDEVTLHAGDLLVMFTDGVVERGGSEELFGEPDLQQLAARYRHLSAPDLLGRILEELEKVTGAAGDDDTTLLILKAL